MGWATIYGAALGFLASVVPHVWKLIIDIWVTPGGSNAQNAEAEQWALIQSQQQTIDDQQDTIRKIVSDFHYPLAATIIRMLATSVRPALTYAVFILWAGVKAYTLYHGLHVEHISSIQLLPIVWSPDSEGLFAAIVCFWFGDRAMNKVNDGGPGDDADGPVNFRVREGDIPTNVTRWK
jgi:hypothetical protein